MSYGDYPDLKNVKKILVIKLRHLGDVLLTTPVFKILKIYFPHAHIDAYIYKSAYEVIKNHPALNQIFTYDHAWKQYNIFKRLKKEGELINKIRKEKYDLVINLTEGDRGAIASKLSCAKIKVAWDPHKKRKRNIYTHIVKLPGSPRHSVEKNLDSLRRIGINPNQTDKQLTFITDKNAQEKINTLLAEKKFDGQGEKFVLIHPASRWRFKCWPTDRFQAFCKKVVNKNHKILFTAGKEEYEKQMVEKIASQLPKNMYINLSGQLTLHELAYLIKISSCVISVDTFVLHIASTYQKPTLAIFGPTSEVNWGPWQNPYAHIVAKKISCRPCCMDGCGGSKISQCLHELHEEEVFKIFEKMQTTTIKNLLQDSIV